MTISTLFWRGGTAMLLAAAAFAQGQPLIVTASNAANNQLLVYNANAHLVQTISTQGAGGVSGNAGGIATWQTHVAVVNFGSKTVALFERGSNGYYFSRVIPAESSPVSVAFGNNHLYILGTTEVESHALSSSGVSATADGTVPLLIGDGSAAQVGVLAGQLIVSEKSNAIETINLAINGAVTGPAVMVANIPENVNAPFGLVTRGNNAYVTIAHANEISLVRNDEVLTVTGSGTQMAPCWVTLEGSFLFSSNSPSMSISRYAVYGEQIVQDAAVAATLNGTPTDIAYSSRLIGVIDGAGTVSHLSIFSVDEDGNLALKASATIQGAANGMAVVPAN